MHPRSAVAILAAVILLTIAPLRAQNLVSQDGWEGFAIRSPEGRFDRCVLYNRTVPAINASPYGMLGISRDARSNVGLMVFYQPRSLPRGAQTVVQIRIDDRPSIALAGEIMSDFHVVIPGPLDNATLSALASARAIEFTTEAKSAGFTLAGVAAVLDRLRQCVETNAQAKISP